MFLVTNKLKHSTSTGIDISDFGEHHHVQTGSANNSETETDIDAISTAIAMFWGIPSRLRSNRRCPTSENSDRCKLPVLGTVFTSGLYLVLFSEIVDTGGNGLGLPYKTFPKPLWDHLQIKSNQIKIYIAPYVHEDPEALDFVFRRSYNYFQYPSAILEFLGEGSVWWG